METYNLSTELYSSEERTLSDLIKYYDQGDSQSLDAFLFLDDEENI